MKRQREKTEYAPRIERGRVPPNDMDAEGAVLCAVMVDPTAIEIVAGIVQPEHFYSEAHRRIFEACLAVREKGQPVDLVQVGSRLHETERLSQVGGSSYLVEISNSFGVVSNVESYARTVHRKWRARQVIAAAQAIEAEGYLESGGDEDGYVDRAEARMSEIARGGSASSGFVTLQAATRAAVTVWQEADRRAKAGEDIEGLGIPTGLRVLDDAIAGWHPGDVTIVAARPGMGKSSLAFQTLTWVAGVKKRGGECPYGSVMFSLEMPSEQLATRAICAASGVDLRKARQMSFDAHDWRKFITFMQGAQHMGRVLINDKGGITIAEIRSLLRRAQSEMARAKRTLGVVVVDYVQLMEGEGDNREEVVAKISRSLKSIAKEMHVPIVALAQLNRGVESRADKRPMLSDLRESGALEQDADNVIFIYRDDYYNPDSKEPGVAELLVSKQRNGPTGIVKVGWEAQYTRFYDLPAQGMERQ